MAWTEFYCDTATGAQINAGDATANGVVTSTNGDWGNAAANRFTAAAGTPFSGVSVGDFASVYLDGATVAVYIGRVTAVNAGGASLDISSTAKSGTAPTTGATGRSCTTGGKWKGPNAADGFPFGFVQSTMTNVAADAPRVNLKTGSNYAITAAMTHANAGPIRFEGYTGSAGDGGQAIIDGGTSGVSYVLLTSSTANVDYVNLILQNNGATGAANGFVVNTSSEVFLSRNVVNSVRGSGFSLTTQCMAIECEAYACNQSNTSGAAGYSSTAASNILRRCISHDNTGSNTSGFTVTALTIMDKCIADTNGFVGLNCTVTTAMTITESDFYNNVNDGIRLNNASAANFFIENCNLVKNGTGGTGYGINCSGAGVRHGLIRNCGFGSGTAANTTGTTTGLSSLVESGSVTYASNLLPWVDAANGDFRISLATAKGAGRGTFVETAASYTGTVGYPDIGAGQHADAGGTSGVLYVPNLDGV